MREVKLGEILELAGRLAGRDVSALGVPESWKVTGGFALMEGIRRLAAEKFPMMRRIEFRRYRPDWDLNLAYERGQEVWHAGFYWRMTAGTGTGEPGVAECWRKLKPEELAKFIAFEQPWENTVIDPGGVDLDHFAFQMDPKYAAHPEPVKVTSLSELGIELEGAPYEGVFCMFVPEYPTVSFTSRGENEVCNAGDTRYVADTKEVYQCLHDNTTSEPGAAGSETDWQPVRIASVFTMYLARLIASDLMTEDQGKFATRARADSEFEDLQARYHEGVREGRERGRGRFI